MMSDQDQAACPACGQQATVRSLAQMLAASGQGIGPGVRAWAERPSPDAPLSDWSGESSALGESGGGADLGQSVFDFAMAAGAYVLHRTVGRKMKGYVRDRLPAAESKLQARYRQQLELAERYPDLRVCIVDQVVFVMGGSRVVPLARLQGRRPADLDAAMSALVAELRALALRQITLVACPGAGSPARPGAPGGPARRPGGGSTWPSTATATPGLRDSGSTSASSAGLSSGSLSSARLHPPPGGCRSPSWPASRSPSSPCTPGTWPPRQGSGRTSRPRRATRP